MLQATESRRSRRMEGADFTQDHTHKGKHEGIYSRWTDKVVNPHMTLTSVLQTHRSVLRRTHLESDTLMPT